MYLKIWITKKGIKTMALMYLDIILTFETETILKIVPYSYKDLMSLDCGQYPIE